MVVRSAVTGPDSSLVVVLAHRSTCFSWLDLIVVYHRLFSSLILHYIWLFLVESPSCLPQFSPPYNFTCLNQTIVYYYMAESPSCLPQTYQVVYHRHTQICDLTTDILQLMYLAQSLSCLPQTLYSPACVPCLT